MVIKWKGLKLPNWPLVHKQIENICMHISSLDYLGLDIIITENGMKLCEINSHPAMDYEQIMCGPTLAKSEVKKFFDSKGLRKYDARDFYLAYMKSQVV